MELYRNIENGEVPALLRSAYEENGRNIEKAADQLETIDMMLGVLKAKALINSRERSAKTRWTRGRGIRNIFEKIILRERKEVSDV